MDIEGVRRAEKEKGGANARHMNNQWLNRRASSGNEGSLDVAASPQKSD